MNLPDLKPGLPASRPLLAALFCLSCLCAVAPAQAEDSFKCLVGTEEECAYENESLALFIKARDAFDSGRESGDMTEAVTLSRQLLARKNKNGKRIMKMIYLRLRQGDHKNPVEAYQWVQQAIDSGEEYARLDLTETRDIIGASMTPEQLGQAKAK